ncbi:hypothetical protein QMT25_20670 [Cronobacter dublinensis]|uniref:hypothetical protein n=1 Tax=Cronobacter dublinensis TaxID=413497 RepID=UPI0024C3F439|nr:hypothetical protein [Cronobacter dublinensis]MDK1199354.1 hypothetical protein [Cronobacter dublinensis]
MQSEGKDIMDEVNALTKKLLEEVINGDPRRTGTSPERARENLEKLEKMIEKKK